MRTIIAFVGVLGILVFVHEFGHFIVAKMCGVYVDCFSLGFGPKIVGLKFGETEYRISIIPLGGYVRMAGQFDVPEEYDAEIAARYKEVPPHRRYDSQSIPRRLAIIVAGPLMNLIFALPVAIALLAYGVTQPLGSDATIVGSVIHNSPADVSGIVPGDKIVKIDGKEVHDWQAMVSQVRNNIESQIPLVYVRNGEEVTTRITPVIDETKKFMGIGVQQMLRAQVQDIMPNSPAADSDFQKGDVIYKLIGLCANEISYDKLIKEIQEHPNTKLMFEVRRIADSLYNDQTNTFTTAKVVCETKRAGKFEFFSIYASEKQNICVLSDIAPSNFPVQTGDVILKINGRNLNTAEINNYVSELPTGPTSLTIQKMSGDLAKYIVETNLVLNVKDIGQIGILFRPAQQTIKYHLTDAIINAPKIAYQKFEETIQVLKLLVTNKVSVKSLAGPIGIARMAGQAAQQGFDVLLGLMLLLTVNLGILNLLPIPVLDGGHVVLLMIEGVYRKPLPTKFVLWFQKIGFILIMALIVIVIYQDMNRLMSDSTPIGLFVGKVIAFFKQLF